MAWEWVAPVATAATGIAGVTFTWLTSRSGGKTQTELLRATQKHQRDAEIREEERNVFAAFLTALDHMDRVYPKASRVMRPLARKGLRATRSQESAVDEVDGAAAAEADIAEAGENPRLSTGGYLEVHHDAEDVLRTEEGDEEPHETGFRRIIGGLSDDERGDFMGAYDETRASFEDFDSRFQELVLCASSEVVGAAMAVRDDLLEIRSELLQTGEWRFVEPELRVDLIDAMRGDLGYPKLATATFMSEPPG